MIIREIVNGACRREEDVSRDFVAGFSEVFKEKIQMDIGIELAHMETSTRYR